MWRSLPLRTLEAGDKLVLNALSKPQYASIFISSKFPPQHSSAFFFLLSHPHKCLDLCLCLKCKMTEQDIIPEEKHQRTKNLSVYCMHVFTINHLISGNNTATSKNNSHYGIWSTMGGFLLWSYWLASFAFAVKKNKKNNRINASEDIIIWWWWCVYSVILSPHRSYCLTIKIKVHLSRHNKVASNPLV